MSTERHQEQQSTLQTEQQALVDAAFTYAHNGWPVFPLHGKLPYKGSHGHKDATTDLNQIEALWQEHPGANIGLATGAVSGVIVLDIDPRHDGHTSLKELQQRYEPLPITRMSRTAHGGLHKFYEHPRDGNQYPNTVHLDGLAGLDIRGDGGYVVLPPSTLFKRLRYVWTRPEQPIVPAPAWLTSLFTPKQEQTHRDPQPLAFGSTGDHFLDLALTRAAGRRDATGFWLACQLRDDGLSEEEATIIMRAYALQTPKGDHPYTEADALRNLRSAYHSPQRERARRPNP